MRIEFEGVTLSSLTEADGSAVVDGFSDPQVAVRMLGPWPFTDSDFDGFLRNCSAPGADEGAGAASPKTWAFGVREGDGALQGMVTVTQFFPGVGDISCWLVPGARGRGIMRRAIRALQGHASDLGLRRLSWFAAVGNWDSRRVAWSCGFRFEGTQRAGLAATPYEVAELGRTEPHDVWMFGWLAGDPTSPVEGWIGPLAGQPGVQQDPHRPADLVRRFHEVYACPILDEPTLDVERLGMRMDLILEECAELVGAVLGKKARAEVEAAWVSAKRADEGERDLVETADALADMVYVIYGMALETGIDLPVMLSQVQASNLSKLDTDGSVIYREDGKVLKGPNFFPPQIAAVIARGRE